MDSFIFYNPVKLHFGENALEKLSNELAQYGKKVLVAYGGAALRKMVYTMLSSKSYKKPIGC